MKRVGPMMTYRKLRAPRNSGQVLIDPSAESIGEHLATNRSRWDRSTHDILGVPLNQLARSARNHLLNSAFDYTSGYRTPGFENDAVDADTQLVLSGHQPRMFHPGVWFKNFVLHSIAQSRKAVGINLIIDNDLCLTSSIRVPTGTTDQPGLSTVAFDQPASDRNARQTQEGIPFEAREIADVDFFRSFPQRVHTETGSMVTDGCVNPLWVHACKALDQTTNLGRCLSQARHQLEGEYGLETLEVPLSQLCDHASFLQVAAYLLQDPVNLQERYGDAIVAYRQVHRLRSQSHPAPLLVTEPNTDAVDAAGDWTEVPFWVWSATDPTRDRLFVRRVAGSGGEPGDLLEACRGIPSRGGQRFALPISTPSEAENIGQAWQKRLEQNGFRIRPRALITTLFARVFLSDLFLHGIGGAKYDQVTDQLIQSLFGLTPPTYLTVTATLHLPFTRSPVDTDDVRQINGMLRELWYHPEKMLVDGEVIQATKMGQSQCELKKKKKKLLREIPPRGQRKAWNDDLVRINTALREHTKPLRSILQQQRSDLIQRVRSDSILASREYAFCLFPSGNTGQNLLDMAVTVS